MPSLAVDDFRILVWRVKAKAGRGKCVITRPDSMVPRAAFHAEAVSRLTQMKKTGAGIPAAEVFDYLRNRVQGKIAAKPRSRIT